MLSDPLFKTTERILIGLRQTPTLSKTWCSLTEKLCLDFFSPSRIGSFLENFWTLWYPNCPIIHKPTFSMEHAPLSLLCPMIILGACTSPVATHRRSATAWLDPVEELVFTENLPWQFPIDQGNCNYKPSQRYNKLQCLQGAYLVCAYQNWEGTDETKRRIRRERFSILVTVSFSLSSSFPILRTILDYAGYWTGIS